MHKQIKKVLIIGDSYTAIYADKTIYPHWITFLSNKYQWNITNLSWPGTGPGYAIVNFLENAVDFDLCIFAWSEASRSLYHKHTKDINVSTALDKSLRGVSEYNYVYDAAKLYFEHFSRPPMVDIENIALLMGLDEFIQKKYADKLFWHFYCFPSIHPNFQHTKKEQIIPYKFKQGLTMYPTLSYFSHNDPHGPATLKNDLRLGHLSSPLHERIFLKLDTILKNNITSNGDIFILDDDFTTEDINIGIRL
jgi:hypothetical protein